MTTETTHADETRRILDLLAQSKITVDEADRLLKAVQAARAKPAADEAAADSAGKRWIRVNLRTIASEPPHKAKDVNIRVPIAAVKGGMRLGAIIAEFAGERAAQRMKERGMDIDLSKINGPEFETFLKSLDDVNIDIDDGRKQVRITCE